MDITYNLDKFISGETNILFITGLSGSGKSTLANKYAKKYNAEVFELDKIRHWEKYIDRRPYNLCEKLLQNHINKIHKAVNPSLSPPNEYQDYANSAFNFLYKYALANPMEKFIFEGIQIANHIGDNLDKYLSNVALIIIQVSIDVAYKRRMDRDKVFMMGGKILTTAEGIQWYRKRQNRLQSFIKKVKNYYEKLE